MKKILLLILFFSSSIILTFGQKFFENKQYEFSIQEPKDWIITNNPELIKNLENMEVSEKALSKLIADYKGSILLTSFYKYNPKTHAGLIPIIQINVRSKSGSNFEQFKNVILESAKGFKQYFADFEYVEEPKEVLISGIKSIFFVGKFTMKTQDGQELKVRSRTYAIPYKSYFFQVNFTDGQVKEDCSKVFDELSKTIVIGRK